MKKHIIKISILALGIIGLTSCDKGFDELNINRTAATAINPAFTLNSATVNLSFPSATIFYETGVVQQMVTPNSGVLVGANFNQINVDNTQQIWQRYYRSVVRNTYDVIVTTKDQPTRANLYNMARILQSYAFMVLTDTYGDVPYGDAGKGYTDQVISPKYESQQAIYTGIIKELGEASAALDASKTVESADVLFGGNIDRWKKFANSLLLRAGMRLSKVDAAQAQQVVQKAVSGGLMASNADNAFIRHDANYTNGIGNLLNATEASNVYMAEPFVNFLKTTADPRLRSIAVRYVGANSGPQQVAARASIDPAVQIGMPMGYDNSSISGPVKTANLVSFYDYTQVDRARLCKVTAPLYLCSYAQTQLLLAEATKRGWVTSGNAETFFKNGVRAHMEQMATYDAASAVANDAVDAYLTANPYNDATALEQINNQYWIASFLNGPEVFANFRRSGFPKLKVNPYPGKGIKGEFIRRLTYPNSELSVNAENLKAAVTRQGADDLDTRVWWDK